MTTMQDRITAELQHITEAAGLKFVNNGDWANTGHIYVQQGWETLLDARYDFQTDHCTLHCTGPAMEAWKRSAWRDVPRLVHWDPVLKHMTVHAGYADSGEVQRQLDLFTAMLATVAVPVNGQCSYCGHPGANPGELENFNPSHATNLACRNTSECKRRQVRGGKLATAPPEGELAVGDVLYGFCGGCFGRDSYDDKRVEAIGADWVVARTGEGHVAFYAGDPGRLREYRQRP